VLGFAIEASVRRKVQPKAPACDFPSDLPYGGATECWTRAPATPITKNGYRGDEEAAMTQKPKTPVFPTAMTEAVADVLAQTEFPGLSTSSKVCYPGPSCPSSTPAPTSGRGC